MRRFHQLKCPALLLSLVFVGCALPHSPLETAVGKIQQGDESIPFIETGDLLIAGLVDEALGFARIGRYMDAESKLRQAEYLSPNNEAIFFNLAVVLDQQGRSDEAEQILRPLIAKQKDNVRYREALAQALTTQRKYDEALKLFKSLFEQSRSAGNWPLAGLYARKISVAAWQAGRESDALCYSWEAYVSLRTPEELGRHARVLLSLNLYRSVKDFVESEIKTDPGKSKKATVMHALGLARYQLGDLKGALEAEGRALDFVSKDPNLGAEANVAWYLIRSEIEKAGQEVPEVTEDELATMKEQVEQLADSTPTELITWPAKLREELAQAAEDITAEDDKKGILDFLVGESPTPSPTPRAS